MACFMAIVVCVALTADTARVPSAPPPHTVHHPGSGQRKQGRQLHQQVPAVQEHAAAALTTGPGRTSVCLSVCLSVRPDGVCCRSPSNHQLSNVYEMFVLFVCGVVDSTVHLSTYVCHCICSDHVPVSSCLVFVLSSVCAKCTQVSLIKYETLNKKVE